MMCAKQEAAKGKIKDIKGVIRSRTPEDRNTITKSTYNDLKHYTEN